MKKIFLLFTVLALMATASFAAPVPQPSKFDVFAGYSFASIDPGSGIPNLDFNGGVGSLAYNYTKHFSMVAELGGYHSGGLAGTSVEGTGITYLFGPKIRTKLCTPIGKLTPFAQVLVGGAYGSLEFPGGGGVSKNAFAASIGGGVDYELSKHWAARVAQVDYLLTDFPTGPQNGYRVSTGLVYHF